LSNPKRPDRIIGIAEVPAGSGKHRLRYVLDGKKSEKWFGLHEAAAERAADVQAQIDGAAPAQLAAAPPPLAALPPPAETPKRARGGTPEWWGALIRRYAATVAINPGNEQAQRALRAISSAAKVDLALQRAPAEEAEDRPESDLTDEELLAELLKEVEATRKRIEAKRTAQPAAAAGGER